MRRATLAILAVSLALSVLLAGCEAPGAKVLERSQAELNAGRLEQAYESAAKVSTLPSASQATRQQAAYVAGTAAYRLKRPDRAEQYLRVAARSRDPQVAANARAMLGVIYTDQRRYDEAAGNLLAAAEHLAGQDKANAYYYGALAQQKLGRWPSARANLSLAMSHSRDPQFRQQVAEQLRVTGYTLQTGAFSKEDNARRAAESIAPKTSELKMGLPRVVPATDPTGKQRLYLVQVGQFTSWPTASEARQRLGANSAIVVPLAAARR